MTATEHVVLVDLEDNPIGTAEKLPAHQKGLCHRAFSICIVRQSVTTEILLQQRALSKYHSSGLWTNTCCSHPRPDENIIEAGERRLQEEMGIKTSLKSAGKFHYVAHFANGLTENEIDHVLIGTLTDESFEINPTEVKDYRWINLSDLHQELSQFPDQFTPWLKQALEIAEHNIEKYRKSCY